MCADVVFGGTDFVGLPTVCYDGEIVAQLNPGAVLVLNAIIERNHHYELSVEFKCAVVGAVFADLDSASTGAITYQLDLQNECKCSCGFTSFGVGQESLMVSLHSEAPGLLVSKVRLNGGVVLVASTPISTPVQAEPVVLSMPIADLQPEPISIEVVQDDFTFGGPGFKWIGKKLNAPIKRNEHCVELFDRGSCIYLKLDQNYTGLDVRLTAKVSRGNGLLGLDVPGVVRASTRLYLTSPGLCEYSASLDIQDLTNTQRFLRIFRPSNSSSCVSIKSVSYKPRGIRVLPPAESTISSDSTGVYSRQFSAGEFDVIFRPYDKHEQFTKAVDAVLIREQTDVPLVSIITPTRDGVELIKACWTALKRNTAYPNWEWIVGDSCSSDDTVEYLRAQQDPRIKVVERGTVEGSFSSINNELVKHAIGQYVLFLNNDTEPQPFWLYSMMSKLCQDEVGIVGSRLLYPDGSLQHCGIVFVPQGPGNIGRGMLSAFAPGFERVDRFVQAVTGACLLISKADFEAVGGFGEEYWWCYEDVDLCLKVKQQLSKRTLYSATSIVIHNESATQRKHGTVSALQKKGNELFLSRWMGKIDQDFQKLRDNPRLNVCVPAVSFVSCVSSVPQFSSHVVGSLFKGSTKRNYEVIPILNPGNIYSAAQALNLGLAKANAPVIVACHQDVLFYKDWLDNLLEIIAGIERKDRNWGVLGTAGISENDDTMGVVYTLTGGIDWQQTKRLTFDKVQTVDEHCLVFRRNSKLRFDESFQGFHMYGVDLALASKAQGMNNYGILNPLVHDSSSGSLSTGKAEFMRWLNHLADKWKRFKVIRTPTARITGSHKEVYLKFK